ncbi:MAG: hydrogenase maturation protease [Dethiobacteria bacterium]|jgi:hydrogenase maturation protease
MPETGLKSNRRLLVLGLGNYLCGDDSIGFRLAEKLSSSYFHPQVDIINGGTVGMGLLYLFEEYSDLMIVDAIDVGAAPGRIFQFQIADIEKMSGAASVSNHQEGAANLLRCAKLIGTLPSQATIIGIQVKKIAHEVGLSEELNKKLKEIAENITKEIDRYVTKCMS